MSPSSRTRAPVGDPQRVGRGAGELGLRPAAVVAQHGLRRNAGRIAGDDVDQPRREGAHARRPAAGSIGDLAPAVQHIGAAPSEWHDDDGLKLPDGKDHILFLMALILGGGTLLQLIQNGLVKAMLFLVTGNILLALGTTDSTAARNQRGSTS